jgi:peptidoglycan biosynthesis protein MviN/MurJ (putative lipid II flippase)
VALSAGILNTWRRFAVPAATPVLLNVAMIAAAYWGAPWFATLGIEPIFAMAGGVLLGGALQLGVQLPALRKLGMLPRVSLRWSGVKAAWAHPGTRRVTTLMLPALLGVSVAQVSLLINTQIASHLATGSVSWLTYADRLMEFPTAMLGVALGVVLLPNWPQRRRPTTPCATAACLTGAFASWCCWPCPALWRCSPSLSRWWLCSTTTVPSLPPTCSAPPRRSWATAPDSSD